MRAFFLGCLLLGCSSSGGGGGVAVDGGVGGAGGSAGSSTTVPGEQTPTCKRYVSCVAATNAGLLGSVIDTYGPEGSCWVQGAELVETCNGACVEALVSANQAYPDEAACGECTGNAECKDPAKPFCSESTHRCTVSSDPDLAMCLNVLGCVGPGDGFVCAEKNCGAEYSACFGPNGKCAPLMTCTDACGGCTEPGCIESCAEVPVSTECYDECMKPAEGPLFECMQTNFCGC